MTSKTIIQRTRGERNYFFECIESNNDLLENLKCSICLDIFVNPVITDCGHVFCIRCLKNVRAIKCSKDNHKNCSGERKCPECRNEVHSFQFKENKKLSSITDSLKVKCLKTSKNKICSKILNVGGIGNHVHRECEYSTVSCRYCNLEGVRSFILEHIRFCLKNPKALTRCMKCYDVLLCCDLDYHRKKFCPIELICNHHIGCTDKIKKRLYGTSRRLLDKYTKIQCLLDELELIHEKITYKIEQKIEKEFLLKTDELRAGLIKQHKDYETNDDIKKLLDGLTYDWPTDYVVEQELNPDGKHRFSAEKQFDSLCTKYYETFNKHWEYTITLSKRNNI